MRDLQIKVTINIINRITKEKNKNAIPKSQLGETCKWQARGAQGHLQQES